MTISMSNAEYKAIEESLKILGVDLDKALKSNGAVHIVTHSHTIQLKDRVVVSAVKTANAKLNAPAKIAVKTLISKFL